MAKAYWISCNREIKDANKLLAYAQLAKPAIEAGGGQFLARGVPDHVYDAGLKERVAATCWDITADSVTAAAAARMSHLKEFEGIQVLLCPLAK